MNEPEPRKSLGQHWLADAVSLQAMVDAAGVTGGDTVLEIGPGLGALTARLVERAGAVVAIELDEQLAGELIKRVPAKNLTVVQADILRFNLSTLPRGYKVVANIPYYLTSNLVRVLSEAGNPPSLAALLMQKEVAERVAAAPGDMSLLSVTAQWYWHVSLGRVVPAELFTPPPKVDSQILVLKRRERPLFDDVLVADLFRVAKAGFSQRRKTLLNSLSAGLQLPKDTVKSGLEQAGISPRARAQNLSLAEWHAACISLTR